MSDNKARHVPQSVWSLQFKHVISESIKVDANDIADEDDDDYDFLSSCGCHKRFSNDLPMCNDHKCVNFATQVECSSCSKSCQNQRIGQKQYANLEVCETPGKGYGLFTKQDLKKKQFLMEYVGELVSTKELNYRLAASKSDNHLYMMQLKPGTYIDARYKGSMSRYINHSCEPNCTIEIWTVSGRLRVGIFTTKEISAGTELNFDYQWEPSNRPPTKCRCGAATCRGYLEILSDTQKELTNKMNNTRKGIWIPGNEATKEDGETQIDAAWLVGKRIKIWWDGNNCYFEADVQDIYIPTNDNSPRSSSKNSSVVYNTLFYLDDGNTKNELVVGSKNDWMVLDETREDLLIKKKNREEFVDENEDGYDDIYYNNMNISTNSSDNYNNTNSNNYNNQFGGSQTRQVPSSRVSINIPYITATGVVNTAYESNLISDSSFPTDFNDHLSVYKCLFSLIEQQYNVQSFMSPKDMYQDGSHDIILFGIKNNVDDAKNGLTIATTNIIKQKNEQSKLESKNIMKLNQSLSMTNDWRVLPPGKSFISTVPCNHIIDGLCSYNDLPVTKTYNSSNNSSSNNSIDNIISIVSDSIRKSLLRHLKGLLLRTKTPHSTGLNAVNLLLKYLRVTDDSTVSSDTTSVIAAIWILASKSRGLFKSKILKKIVCSAYCQAFSRNESEVNSSSDSYVKRTLEREKEIFELIRHDIYVMDPCFLFYSNLINRRNVDYINIDWTAYGKNVNDALEFSIVFATVSPSIWMSLPSELACIASCMIVSISKVYANDILLYKLGHSTPMLANNDFNKNLSHTIEFESIFEVAIKILKIKPEIIKWTIDNLCQYAIDISPEEITWFRSKGTLLSNNSDDWKKTITQVSQVYSRWSASILYAMNNKLIGTNSATKSNANNYTVVNNTFNNGINRNYATVPPFIPSNTAANPYYQQSLAPPQIPLNRPLSTTVQPPAIPSIPPPPIPYHAIPNSKVLPPPLPILPAPVLPPPLPPSLKLSSSSPSIALNNSNNNLNFVDNSVISVANNGNFSSTKLRVRCPWIVDKNNYSSVLTLEDPELLKMIAKEIYSTSIPIDSLERINASQSLSLLSARNSVISDQIQVSIRMWPSIKQTMREARKAIAADLGNNGTGISPQAIQELAMLQHIHYLSTISNDSINSGINSHVVIPIGIMEIPDIISITTKHKTIKKESIAEINKKYNNSNNSSISSEIASLMNTTEKVTNGSSYNSGSFSPVISSVIDKVMSSNRSSTTFTPEKGGVNNNSIQKYLIIPSVLTSLQAFLPNILTYTKSNHNISLSANLAKDLCKDLILAIQHCTNCGVYFKWLSLDQIYISNEGKLLIGGLSGASIVMPPDLEFDETYESKGKNSTSKHSSSSNNSSKNSINSNKNKESSTKDKSNKIKSSKSSKRDSSSSIASPIWIDSEKITPSKSNSESSFSSSNIHESILPYLSTTCPEIILGKNQPTPQSSIWCAASVCVYILTGKPIVKTGNTEEKHMQYLYKTLGTPKIMGYNINEFEKLPHALSYGKYIKDDDGSKSESRSRIVKLCQQQFPSHILKELSYTLTTYENTTDIINGGKSSIEQSDSGGVIDFLKTALHLVPSKRTTISEILTLPLFTNKTSSSDREKDVKLLIHSISGAAVNGSSYENQSSSITDRTLDLISEMNVDLLSNDNSSNKRDRELDDYRYKDDYNNMYDNNYDDNNYSYSSTRDRVNDIDDEIDIDRELDRELDRNYNRNYDRNYVSRDVRSRHDDDHRYVREDREDRYNYNARYNDNRSYNYRR